jgi:hypothetical protein
MGEWEKNINGGAKGSLVTHQNINSVFAAVA